MDLIIASSNKSKFDESQRITKRLTSKRGSDEYFRILSTPYKMLYSEELCDCNVHITSPHCPLPDVEETGLSLYENAGIKARATFDALKYQKCPVFADDSGIWVDGIGGPGVFTARYGTNRSFKKVIEQLCTVHSTGGILATLTSVICLITADGKEHYFSGSVHGVIDTTINLDGDYTDWKQCFIPKLGFVRDSALNSLINQTSLDKLAQCTYDDICHRHNSIYEMLMYLKKKGDI